MSSIEEPHYSNTYWRSLAQLAGSPEFRASVESEFPAMGESEGMSRRRWLQLMGASLALATAGGCRWEKAEILPFANRPGDRVPGKPQRFATAMDSSGSAMGLLVTSVDGRPVKIEGNPKHPASRGATDALAQAAILQLYDPDRSQNVYRNTGDRRIAQTWEQFVEFARSHFDGLRKAGGAGFRILSEASSSPTLARMRTKLLETFPEARWHEYEPISRDNEREGARLAFGRPVRTHLALDEAAVIACLDSDLLGSHPSAVRHAQNFAKGREVVDGSMNRLYAVESCFSITGAAADHRLPLRSEQIPAFATLLEQEVTALLEQPDASTPERRNDRQPQRLRFARALAEDLVASRGRSVVTAGPSQPAEVHAAVCRINAALDNFGRTVSYTADPDPQRPAHTAAITALVADMEASKVETLLILGGNPVYNAPVDLDYAKALKNVETTIRLSQYHDETSRLCTWHIPRAHFLESWGDARAYDGTYSIVQPLIEPLYGGKSPIELLGTILGAEPPKVQELVRETFRQIGGQQDAQKRWRRALHDGLLAGSQWPSTSPSVLEASGGESLDGLAETGVKDESFEIVFCPDPSVYDGRFANNGWLQEMPDPMTRLTWGNAAVVSPATAEALGVEDQTLVKLKYKGRELEIPAYVMPGQATGSVAVSLGYGRTAAGLVGGSVADGIEPVGVDAYKLRTSDAMGFGSGLTVEPTGKRVALASTQDHFAIDTAGMSARARRVDALVCEATLAHYKEHPEFAKHAGHYPLESLWEEHQFKGHHWGMAIDLSKCIGCGACMVACQAENNIPVVGRQRILDGREMHWIRVDRYFKGDPENPQVVHQPVACHHCELAPCEQVCPVAATVHSEEGLNDMVYNRCVGTRYCANNCPYKVRRFNFFNYHKQFADVSNEVKKMVYNPEVTVRSRGVMEKCTYCVQRIQAAKINAKNDRRPVEDAEIRTACQQVCPTEAIIFGDLADPQSKVAQAHAADRSYAMLAELNIKPRTKYLARIRNPNPELEDGI